MEKYGENVESVLFNVIGVDKFLRITKRKASRDFGGCGTRSWDTVEIQVATYFSQQCDWIQSGRPCRQVYL